MNPHLNFVHKFIPGSSSRTLLLLHGTGGDENDLVPLGREMDPTASLLSPRGPVMENGNARFFRRLAEGVFDLEDLKRRTDDLAEFVRAAAEQYRFDSKQVVAFGYSNGANIAASMLLRRPGVLSAAILFRAMVPLVPDQLPNLSGTRIWIGGGKEDTLIPPRKTEALAAMLQQAGAEVTLRLFDAGHALTSIELPIAQRWLRAILPAG
jgi:predicted esterase